jgi:hypothetical protein
MKLSQNRLTHDIASTLTRETPIRLNSPFLIRIGVVRFLGGVCLFAFAGCGSSPPAAVVLPPPSSITPAPAGVAKPVKLSDQELEARIGPQVNTFCSQCHAVPNGSEAPRHEWRDEVQQAYGFHANSPRKEEPTPDFEAVVDYFQRKSLPYEEFSVPPLGSSDPGRLRFKTCVLQLDSAWTLPAVAGMTWIPPQNGERGSLVVCEMRSGGLFQVGFGGGQNSPKSVAVIKPGSHDLSNPCHAQPCDLNGDGLRDLVVGDLGAFHPGDEMKGRVVWLRGTSAGHYEPVQLAASLGRVADVQPGDFDGDGDQDLIVGEFGWRNSGNIRLLKNLGSKDGELKFELTTLDPRHGTIHVPVADLNQDGQLDFVALIGQEHEVVEAFLGNGDGTFAKQRIHAAPNPSWGSSGIQLVDLDGDGDLDILYANGDHFDRGYFKPYHALHWLENQGAYPWVEHELAKMPGCHRTLAGDLDSDGDLDVVAVSLLYDSVREQFGKDKFDAVCWLEQTGPGQFARRTLELGSCDHATLEMGDFDADGDQDLAVGNLFLAVPAEDKQPPSLTIWWNETPRPKLPQSPAGARR